MPLLRFLSTAALWLAGCADSARVDVNPSSVHPPAPPAVADLSSVIAWRSWRKSRLLMDGDSVAKASPAVRAVADSIVVEKSQHRLSLYRHGMLLHSYLVALGQQPKGDKVRVGDNRTPEGLFRIESRNARSAYHRALRISYPDDAHRARARSLGVSPGGDIMIHGLPARQAWVGAAHRDFDWTEGCIAVTNKEIDEIWDAVPVGIPIQIKP